MDTYSEALAGGYFGAETYRVILDNNEIIHGSRGPPVPLPGRRYIKLLHHISSVAPFFNRESVHNGSEQSKSKVPNINEASNHTVATNSNDQDSPQAINSDQSSDGPNSTKSDEIIKIVAPKNGSEYFNEHNGKAFLSWRERRLPYYDVATSPVSDDINASFLGSADDCASPSATSPYPKPILKVDERAIRDGFLKFFVSILKDYKRYLIYGTPEDPDPMTKFKFDEFIADQPADWRPFLREMVETQAFSQFVDERVLHLKKNQDVIFFDESIDAKMDRYMLRKLFKQTTDTPFLNDRNVNIHVKTYVPPSPDTSGLPVNALYKYNGFPRLDSTLFSKPRNMKARFSIMDRSLSQIRFKRKNSNEKTDLQPQSSLHTTEQPSAMSCIYSCYIVMLAQHIIASEYRRVREKSRVLTGGRDKQKRERAAAKLALRTIFEVLNCLSRADHSPDEIVYRYMADACGACGDPQYLIDLLVFMDDEGLAPDHHILHALAKALSSARVKVDEEKKEEIAPLNGDGGSVVPLQHSDRMMSTQLQAQLLALYLPPQGNKAENSTINNVELGDDPIKSLSPAAVWTVSNWRRYYNPASSSLFLRRSTARNPSAQPAANGVGPPQSMANNPVRAPAPAVPAPGNGKESTVERLLFGPQPIPTAKPQGPAQPSTLQAVKEVSIGQPEDRWSLINPMEGYVPKLKWKFSAHNDSSEDPSKLPVFAASKKLNRLMRVSEKLLEEFSEELVIDLQNPFGSLCPGAHCPADRVLTIGEIHQGWENMLAASKSPSGSRGGSFDLSNTYTTKCVHCGHQFIPRFFVLYCQQRRKPARTTTATSSLTKTAEDACGDDASPLKTAIQSREEINLCCELLNPWVLTKEILNILYLSCEHHPGDTPSQSQSQSAEMDIGVDNAGDDGGMLFKLFVCTNTNNPLSAGSIDSQQAVDSGGRSRAFSNGPQQQRAVIFWNILVAFRLRGLPYSFLLTDSLIAEAFPPPVNKTKD